MRIIYGEVGQYSPAKGIELEGTADALVLADRLNSYAQRCLTGDPEHDVSQGLEALKIQAKLLKDLGTTAEERPFGFRAEDVRSGIVLKAAAESESDAVEQAEWLQFVQTTKRIGELAVSSVVSLEFISIPKTAFTEFASGDSILSLQERRIRELDQEASNYSRQHPDSLQNEARDLADRARAGLVIFQN